MKNTNNQTIENKEEVYIVSINPELYNDAIKIVELVPTSFASINDFVEIAIRNQIHTIKFNIENMQEIVSKDGRLVAPKNKGFTNCILCNRFFLKEDVRNKNDLKICTSCIVLIRQLSRIIGER